MNLNLSPRTKLGKAIKHYQKEKERWERRQSDFSRLEIAKIGLSNAFIAAAKLDKRKGACE